MRWFETGIPTWLALPLAVMFSLVAACENEAAITRGNGDGGGGDGGGGAPEEPPPICGNGIVEVGETCDDGNTDNTDACVNCGVHGQCGDGVLDPELEECDDGKHRQHRFLSGHLPRGVLRRWVRGAL